MTTLDTVVIERCKRCSSQHLAARYDLGRSTVLECGDCGLRFLNVLDPAGEPDASELTDERRHHIGKKLQSNPVRFPSKVALIANHLTLKGARCMDIGAGGGLFLKLLADKGATVDGIEPVRCRRLFAEETYGIALRAEPLERAVTPDDIGAFDLVTAWDVVEHVNDPFGFLRQAASLVKPGGLLALDTPARDGNLYRLAAVEHAVTGGRSVKLLNTLYSPHPFGHKQILRRSDLLDCLGGFAPVVCKRISELSFPVAHHVRYLLRSDRATAVVAPIASRLLAYAPLQNKTVAVFRRPH